MENLERYTTAAPDLGQHYWMQKNRIERCRGLGLPKMLSISAASGALSYLLAHTAIWANSLPFPSGEFMGILIAATFVMSVFGCLVTGFGALGVSIYGTVDAFQLRRWRRALPPIPENYSEEMAKKAYYLELNVNSYNSLLTKTEESLDDLRVMQAEIEHGFDFTQNYLTAMSGEDVDVLTLQEENPSC